MRIKQMMSVLPILAVVACGSTAEKQSVQRVEALADSIWAQSEWISVTDAPVVTDTVRDGSRAADGASWFLLSLKAEKAVKSARWMTTALGVYDLYVNGRLVGSDLLKPGFTHWQKTRRSFTYDVTELLREDENVFSVEVTPGWWADKIITPAGQVGMNGQKCAFRSVLELTYIDGTTQTLGTDTTQWKAGIAGPVTHAAIFDGEDYDARIPMGFDTPEKLSTPELNQEFDGEILPSDGAEICLREDIALKPVKAYVWKDVEQRTDSAYGRVVVSREYQDGESMVVHEGEHLVIDFGQNAAALPRFNFQASEGTVFTCLPAELLNDSLGQQRRGMDGPEGSVHRLNLRTPNEGMMLHYTFAASENPVEWMPRKTFFGYRYLSLSATGDVTLKSICSVPVSSITKEMETGTLVTGNELVNKIISNTLWGQRSNYLSVPTDCPQRNERLGWTADTQVFSETGTFFANTDRFFHKWLCDLRDTQSPLGGYPGVAPVAQYGANSDEMMRVGWADAGIIVPWTVWKQFGDVSILEESWESMERFIQHVDETRYDHNALAAENGHFQWADWLSYEPLESFSAAAWRGSWGGKLLPEAVVLWNFLSASYWAIDAQMMADMARATGRDSKPYKEMTQRAKDYLRQQFLDANGTFKTPILNTMQTPALFVLRNNLLEGEAKENTIARLRENFAQHDNCLQTGFLGTSILMQTLTDNGMSDIAYELLFQRKNPSWLYSVDNGATTIWERWNSYMIEYGMGPRGMNSFNHYAYGCVCQWLWETAAGINADTQNPGFKHIILRPVPDKRLGSIDATYQSAAGEIKSEWHYDGDTWIWNFTIPEGATATVTIPGSNETKDYEAGSYTVKE